MTRASVATVQQVLRGERHPHELAPELHDLWRAGFAEGRDRAQQRLEDAEQTANFWYYSANNSAVVQRERERHLERFRVTLARAAEADRWAALDKLAAEEAARMRGAS